MISKESAEGANALPRAWAAATGSQLSQLSPVGTKARLALRTGSLGKWASHVQYQHLRGARSHAAHLPQPHAAHVDLEAVVALHRVLGDVRAGAQVDLPVQLVGLEQEAQQGHVGPGEPSLPSPAGACGHPVASPLPPWSLCNT